MNRKLLGRTRDIAGIVLGERLHFHRRNLVYRINRKVAGEVGHSSRLLKTRKRRRERDLEHRRVVAPDRSGGKKKKIPPPMKYFGSRMRAR